MTKGKVAGFGIALLAFSVILLTLVTVIPGFPSSLLQQPSQSAAKEFLLVAMETADLRSYGFNQTKGGLKIEVKVGELVKIRLVNRGRLPHAFAVVEAPGDLAPAIWSSAIGSPASPINPGEIGTTTFRAERAGTYSYICTVPGHRSLFMEGQIIVEAQKMVQ